MTRANPAQDEEQNPRLTRRQRKAAALRRKALSPVRILMMVLMLPLTTGLIAIGVYLRVSDYDRPDAVVHLVALAGCDAVRKLGAGPFYEGEAGYHKRNDPDGDGVACASLAPQGIPPVQQSSRPPEQRTVGTAKFLKP